VTLPFSGDDPVAFSGWAADGKLPAAGVYLVVDDSRHFAARYGIARPDVARALGAPDLEAVGFEVVVPPHVLTPGSHSVGVLVVDHAAKGYYRNAAQTVIVGGNGQAR
jgi:hypothetical protein